MTSDKLINRTDDIDVHQSARSMAIVLNHYADLYEQYGDVYFSAYIDYQDGYDCAGCCIEFKSPESDAEYQFRLMDEKVRAAYTEKYEREEYERLREKYGQ